MTLNICRGFLSAWECIVGSVLPTTSLQYFSIDVYEALKEFGLKGTVDIWETDLDGGKTHFVVVCVDVCIFL